MQVPERDDLIKLISSTVSGQDRESKDEMIRLQIQDHLVTAGMGGVLPEQPDPTIFKKVLDVGCGTGGWLIEMARTYPSMSLLIGVDVSSRTIEYAHTQAHSLAQRVQFETMDVTTMNALRMFGFPSDYEESSRVQFRVMDALRMLVVPEHYFDLVNQRFGESYLRTWDWPKLLQEFGRVTRPGGVIRLTESDMVLESSSPALTRLNELALEALYKAGHYFTPSGNGVTSQLTRLLEQYGLKDVQTHAYTLECRAGTPEGQHFYEDMKIAFRVNNITPFLKKWTRVPDDYEAIYQQALREMQQPDFEVPWKLLTAWGKNPASSGHSPNA